MIKRLATSITEFSIAHNWIDHAHYAWCQYALEKELGKMLFFVLCLFLMELTHTWLEVGSFILVFYLFRSRMGGWHAQHVWSCQLISMTLVIIVTFVLGPFVESMHQSVRIALDLVIIIITFFVPLVYPLEAHFTQTIKKSNMVRKNVMLFVLAILQGTNLFIIWSPFLTYSLIALLFTDISVLLQYFKLKKEG